MEVNVRDLTGDIAVIQLVGRLNMASAARLREAVTSIVDSGRTRVSIDMSGVDFLDSSGLGAIISALKTTRQAGGDLRIAAPTGQAKLVLQLTNLDRVLTAYDDAETAFNE
ncbi:MAG: STAS domain-containing protein [Pseudolysinimonas sp.]